MFDKKPKPSESSPYYALGAPASQRWNPHYAVPRNSVDSAWLAPAPDAPIDNGAPAPAPTRRRGTGRSGFLNSRRDVDTRAFTEAKRRSWCSAETDEDSDELSGLALSLETGAELYMNDLDNRARWDPRWLNITRRERFENLDSASVTVLDYFPDGSIQQQRLISKKHELIRTLHSRPDQSAVRVLVVSDLSRLVMGLLGQLFSINPEFWFEHLANSGYAASDSGLKLKNAVWLNWAERETRLRYRALPGPGQRTEWNVPRRTQARCWAHMHWGRLGLLNYLGRKGFFENEIEQRLKDGRWLMERDVLLDKRGMLMTKSRQQRADRDWEKQEKKRKKDKHPAQDAPADDGRYRRSKTSNVYRPYSTFEGMPKNPADWTNRDLRVMAPEGASHWSGIDSEGRPTIIIVVDPLRSMKDQKTNQVFPAITFMPRALEIDALTDEEARRTADPDETYLDPPPHPMSKEALKQQKQDKKKKEIKEKGHRLKERLATVEDGIDADAEKANAEDDESSSSDSDYDEEYDKKLRAQYEDPRPYVRDRDFARKYALTTHDLLVRYLSKSTAVQLAGDGAFVSSILLQMVLDDTWQLVAELRLELDHLDGDLGAGMLRQLLESYGHTILQNTNWVRATLQDLGEWTKHLAASSKTLSYPADLTEELADLRAELADLANRTEKSITLLTSTMAIAQSTLVIEQTSGINKLTELAFVFIPISFITAVFSMQVRELTETPPRLWIWGVCLAAIVLVTYVIRMVIRSPSFRMFALRCRATALSRYSSTNSATAAKQLSTVGNRAILKFVIAATWAMSLILFVSGLGIVALFVARAGIWLGLIGTAVYFIITRWPDPTVLAVCFVSLPLAVTAWRVAWFWGKEIDGVIIGCITAVANMIERLVPTKDEVEDEDLAMEGVETFARQAIMLVT